MLKGKKKMDYIISLTFKTEYVISFLTEFYIPTDLFYQPEKL